MAKDSLLQEVDNALRWQRVQQLWQRNSRQIIVLLALTVLTLSALLYYQQEQRHKAQAESDILLRNLSNKQINTKDQIQLNGARKDIALLMQAQKEWEKEDVAGTATTLSMITGNHDLGFRLLQDYACFLKSALKVIDDTLSDNCPDETFKTMGLEFEVIDRLEENDYASALRLLGDAPALQNEPARITMLRAYVRSHSEPPTPIQESSENAAP